MMRQQTLLGFMKARREYLDLNMLAGMSTTSKAFAEMGKSTVAALGSPLKATASIDSEEAAAMISLLVHAPLPQPCKDECIRLVNEKTWQTDITQDEARPSEKQSAACPYLYLNAKD